MLSIMAGERNVIVGYQKPKQANADVFYENSWALIVGINEYKKHTPLANARNDAEEFAKLLHDDLSFNNVKTLLDAEATREAIREYL